MELRDAQKTFSLIIYVKEITFVTCLKTSRICLAVRLYKWLKLVQRDILIAKSHTLRILTLYPSLSSTCTFWLIYQCPRHNMRIRCRFSVEYPFLRHKFPIGIPVESKVDIVDLRSPNKIRPHAPGFPYANQISIFLPSLPVNSYPQTASAFEPLNRGITAPGGNCRLSFCSHLYNNIFNSELPPPTMSSSRINSVLKYFGQSNPRSQPWRPL